MSDWSAYRTTEIIHDQQPWYALQLFGLKQKNLYDRLASQGIDVFVPLQNVDFIDREGKHRHELRPVVSNLLFVKKNMDDLELAQKLEDFKGHYHIIRKERGSKEYYHIPAKQMHDFITLCNPDLLMKKFLSEEEASLKPGARVRVHHGPLAGLTGRLVRSSGKYYLLKEIPGMAVMIKVTKWCCQEEKPEGRE